MTLSMWEQEKFEDGHSQGLSQGRSEGFSQGRSETINAAEAFMKAKGLPVEFISEFKSTLMGSARA